MAALRVLFNFAISRRVAFQGRIYRDSVGGAGGVNFRNLAREAR